MSGEFLGGGLVFAIAAALWLIYLVPTYFRRRHFVATERNAVRLQQTIRALAETADVPDEVRVEASARAVIEQKRVLRQAEAAARAELRHAAAHAVGYDEPGLALARRNRRMRALGALFLLVTLAGVITGIVILVNGGSWEILAISCIAFAAALVIQEAIVTKTSSTDATQVVTPTRSELYDHSLAVRHNSSRQWTPTQLPKPLHLSEGTLAQAVVQSQIAAERMRQSAAESALVERMNLEDPPSVPVVSVPQAQPSTDVSSRLAQMGVVEETAPASLDLDEVLRRRRAV